MTSHRCTHVACVDASLESHALAHPDFRLDVTRNRNVTSDDRLWLRAFPPRGHTGRPVAIVVLEGRLRLARAGEVVCAGAGEVVRLPSREGFLSRREGPRFTSVALEWTPGTLARTPACLAAVDPMPRPDLAMIQGAVDRVASASADLRDWEALLAVLGARGVLSHPTGPMDLTASPPGGVARLSAALDQLLSDLSQRPMLVDLERATGKCSRQIHRLVASFHARYGFDASGWRDALNRRRLLVGTALMTAPGATVGLVAAAIGYGSRTAFWRAFAAADLPPPTVVAHRVREPDSALLSA